MTWHATTDLIETYLDGRLDAARSGSLEQHLLACDDCRHALASASPSDELDALWADLIDSVDRPRHSLVEWLLHRFGVHAHVARLLAATPSLRVSWLAGLILTLAVAVVLSIAADDVGRTPVIFLVITPLLPLLGIAAAYGPALDPAFEISRATSYPSARLFLYRSMAVLVSSVGLSLAASTFVPLAGWDAALWLLPALAATATTVALSTWVAPLRAATISAVGWVTAVSASVIATRTDPGDALDRLVVFRPTGQVVALIVMVVATAVFVVRIDRFDAAQVYLSDPLDIGA
jgi:hypothetical protein